MLTLTPEALAYLPNPDPISFLRFLPIIFLVFIIVNLAIVVYLFIDAKSHNRNFILWPVAAFFAALFFGIGSIIILFIYLATRGEAEIQYEEEETNLGQGIKRAYFYIFSFIALAILFFGIADLIRVILDFNWGSQVPEPVSRYSSYYPRDSFTKNVSFRLAAIIVALPIWFFHWYQLQTNLTKIDDPHDLKITFRTHKGYLYLVSGLTLGVVIIFGIWFVYQFLNLLLGVSNIRLSSFAAPIGYTLVSVVALAYHFSILKSKIFTGVEQKVLTTKPIATKVSEPKVLKEKFCPKCGIKNNPASNFCTNCGTKLT